PNSGMIHPRKPENFKAAHSSAASKNVLNRIVEHVPERQYTGHVGRRHYDRERRLQRFGVGNKIAIVDPSLIPFGFNWFWIVSLGDLNHRDKGSEGVESLKIADLMPWCFRLILEKVRGDTCGISPLQ